MRYMYKRHNTNTDRLTAENFCVLLTATIRPNDGYKVLRNDVSIRERDYIDSIKLWLSKTNFKIVFCENSGYDLKNIREVCKPYKDRVEIIQYVFRDTLSSNDYGYGEFDIINTALRESYFIKNTENIIKVTGRVFVKNILNIIKYYEKDVFLSYSEHVVIYEDQKNIWTVIFIFKKPFLNYLNSKFQLLKYMNFEDFFKQTMNDVVLDKHKVMRMKRPRYIGYSAFLNMPYDIIFNYNFIHKFIYNMKKIDFFKKFNIIYIIGVIGQFLRYNVSPMYKILKPFFPDRK